MFFGILAPEPPDELSEQERLSSTCTIRKVSFIALERIRFAGRRGDLPAAPVKKIFFLSLTTNSMTLS